MKSRPALSVLFLLLYGFAGSSVSGDKVADDEGTVSKEVVSSESESDGLIGDSVAGEQRYKQSCINCHGTAGKGAASYPKISGKDIAYTTSMLETYRDGIKVGPNSALMIMMAKPLSDEEIANLAVYLKDAEQ